MFNWSFRRRGDRKFSSLSIIVPHLIYNCFPVFLIYLFFKPHKILLFFEVGFHLDLSSGVLVNQISGGSNLDL